MTGSVDSSMPIRDIKTIDVLVDIPVPQNTSFGNEIIA
jgi:hypothetical protein